MKRTRRVVFGVLTLFAGMALGVGTASGGDVADPAPARTAGLKSPAAVWETLPSIRTGVKIWAHTSKSPLNCTIMDWTNYTLQDADGYEQAFVKGSSGMLVQAWFAWLGGAGGNIKLHLKDAGRPDYDMAFAEYFKSGQHPHQLWRNQGKMWWTFPCLPFESTFKAAITRRPDWYQYTLHLYREGRFSEALTREDVEALRVRMNAPPGQYPGAEPGNQTQSSTLDLGASQAKALFDVKTAGVVRSIRIAPTEAAGVMDALHLRMTTDGAMTADLPVSMFFGGYRGADMKNARGLPAGYDARNKQLYCFFPMPFWKSMKIELVNKQDKPVQAACEVGWSDRNPYPEESTGVFKVQFNDTAAVKAGAPDFANLDVEGAGILVGCVSKLTGDIEGNFSIFTDGSRTPAVETTGGEDYFNHSYGIHPGVCHPFSGGLAEGTAYRFHVIDYVPFLSSIKLTQDHAHAFTHDRDGSFLSAVYYYHTPKKFLALTDSLDVGKSDAETAHTYRIEGTEGRMRLQTDTAGYEGDFNEPIADEGRWTDKGSSFTVKINPENDGVRIRRRINQMAYHQEVDVYVNGAPAGTWFEQGGNLVLNYDHPPYRKLVMNHYAQKKEEVPSWQNGKMPSKFRDTEFEIPAALTKGKEKLEVRMVTRSSLAVNAADAGLTNEYHYWIYSYAGTGASR